MSAVTAPARPAAARSPAPPPRTAFVLAGGAALGAMQAGMLRALYEHGIVPDLLAGTSAGTLNAAFLASRPPAVASTERLAAIYGAPASSRSAFSSLISGLTDAAATRDRPPAQLDVTR